ncbi:transcription factor KUA1-like [Dioscorea cayenensis subsp. rotundata]|uniref:Transcription factor KUA1-like n=1 Tax=Dioscorea cayennensis subsp. rotundata TaxID=55577 RepID=A0AB40B9K7_DIOCR|nr:transcription factor KUA1-like [Dioscorea cayenensis subsp. rotundata]
MARKCSHCGNNGHNSRTCSSSSNNGSSIGLKLFGVQLLQMASSSSYSSSPSTSSSSSSSALHMKKSFSMDCLGPSSSCYHVCSSSSPSSSSSSSLVSIEEATDHHCKVSNGYLSDGLLGRGAQERKKGVPWTEEEHRTFLAGLEKLGKGDWRGISRNFVTTRTPTQVASHAQKYFLRQTNPNKKKRRSSLFDVVKSSDKFTTPKLIQDSFTLSLAPSSIMSSSSTLDHHHHQQQQQQQQPPPQQPPPQLDLELSISSPGIGTVRVT